MQVLERVGGKTSVESLDMFRHFMVDIISCTVFGSRSGSLENWASNIRDSITAAVYDFPVRGVLVSIQIIHVLSITQLIYNVQRSAVPTWAWNIVCRIPNERVRQVCSSDGIMAEVRYCP